MASRLRQYFVTGLLVWVPVGVTAWVLLWLIGALDGIFGGLLIGAELMAPPFAPLLERLRVIPGLGVVLGGVLIVVTGLLVTNFVGQWLLRQWNRLVTRIPVVRTIYSSVKQVSDTLFTGSGQAFSKALLVQYPHPGSWTVGFLTGQVGGAVAGALDADHVSVFVPTTPNPTSGFLLLVRRADVRELDMSVDEAFKYLISLGVVAAPEASLKRIAAARTRHAGAAPLPAPAAEPADATLAAAKHPQSI
jgi:uncharacterized membrane protein